VRDGSNLVFRHIGGEHEALKGEAVEE